MLGKIYLLCVVFSSLTPTFLDGRVVKTPSGKIEGKVRSHRGLPVGTFLGIPFAKPPVGDRRFRRPEPVEQWNGTLPAKEFRPGCVQYTRNPFPWKDDLPGLTEDCLYLNVWAPMTLSALNRKTVMFWIYGGGFVFGSSRVKFYDGLVLAAEGDVVVVTANYRVGPFGFLYAGTEDAPGNMGLLDLAEALKWVRGNIASFGGDKDSITLFGQSAGAIAAGLFCVSPMTTNHKPHHCDRPRRVYGRQSQSSGRNQLSTIQQKPPPGPGSSKPTEVDAFELARTFSSVGDDSTRLVYPRFGDELLPRDPRKSLANGDFGAVDVMVGSNSGDGALLITDSMTSEFGFFGEKEPPINRTFGASIIRKRFEDFAAPCAVVRQYLGGIREDDFDAIRQQVFTASGDFERACPATYLAEIFAKRGVRTYYYFYTHRPSRSPFAPWMLASHFDETPFVFGYPLRNRGNYTLGERMLSRRMIRAWSTFAKTGIPVFGVWPRYSRENPQYQILDVDSLGTGTGPHRNNCDFFRPFFGF